MNNLNNNSELWCENIIVVDADYIDKVATAFIDNFGKLLRRDIPDADLAHWLDCVALDGGLQISEGEGSKNVEVIFVHDKRTMALSHFRPGNFVKDLTGKAFKDNIAEFVMNSYPVEAQTTKTDFLLDIVRTAANHKDVHRLMVVADCDDGTMGVHLQEALKDTDSAKSITVFTMVPIVEGNYRQDILGYSLLSALGITSEEIGISK